MANFNLTSSATDSLVGAVNESDLFQVGAAGRLVATDTVQGGGGNVTDVLRLTASLTLAAAAFANVRGIERLHITALTGVSAVLDDAMVASTNRPDFQILSGDGGDTVLGGDVVAQAMLLDAGAGDDGMEGGGGHDVLRPGTGADTLRGGAGNDTVETSFFELGTDDRLEGGAGSDVLLLGDGGLLTGALFAALQGFERIAVAPGASSLRVNIAASYAIDGTALTIQGSAENDTLSALHAGFATQLLGEDGHDLLTGGAFGDTLLGGLGNDTLRGLDGADVLDGADGDDRLTGGEGNDSLFGGAGNDVLSGGAGADTLDLGSGTDRADGGAGNDLYRVAVADFSSLDLIADAAGSADTLAFLDFGAQALVFTGALAGRVRGIERFVLGEGNDVFGANNVIGDSAGANAVTIEGGGGNDLIDVASVARLTTPLAFLLRGGAGNDFLQGGRGADTLEGGAGTNLISGGAGNDLLLLEAEGLTAQSILSGGDGNADMLRFVDNAPVLAAALAGVSGIEIIQLADGGQALSVADALAAALGFPGVTLRGGDGDDRIDVSLFAAGRRSVVELGDGDDTLFGGAGNDTVYAGAGLDDIDLGTGTNRVYFGINELTGMDTVQAGAGISDTLDIALGAGQTLSNTVFAEVTGFETIILDGAAGSAARLPSNLVTQSGQASVTVNLTGEGMAVDGRGVAQGFRLTGGSGNDTLFGGSGADTLNGGSGEDRLVGGAGGDIIALGGTTADRDIAVIRSLSDGTVDINGALSAGQLALADRVSGTANENKLIGVDWESFGLAGSTTLFLNSGQDISFGWGANVLPTSYEIAGNAFGSLTAVRNAVGARITGNDPQAVDRIILVIGGADEEEFGVYYFEDRDDNATVDSADILRLLAIGDSDVPTFGSSRGFTLASLDLV